MDLFIFVFAARWFAKKKSYYRNHDFSRYCLNTAFQFGIHHGFNYRRDTATDRSRFWWTLQNWVHCYGL